MKEKKVNELQPNTQEELQWYIQDVLDQLAYLPDTYEFKKNEFEEFLEDMLEWHTYSNITIEAFRSMIGEIIVLFSKKINEENVFNVFQNYYNNKAKNIYEALKDIKIV